MPFGACHDHTCFSGAPIEGQDFGRQCGHKHEVARDDCPAKVRSVKAIHRVPWVI